MGIKKEDVEWVAGLASLELSQKEVETFTHQLGEILEYVEKLKEVSIEGIEPTSHPLGMLIPLRQDRAENPLPVSKALSNAPKKREGHFKVPPVVTKKEGTGRQIPNPNDKILSKSKLPNPKLRG